MHLHSAPQKSAPDAPAKVDKLVPEKSAPDAPAKVGKLVPEKSAPDAPAKVGKLVPEKSAPDGPNPHYFYQPVFEFAKTPLLILNH